MNTPVSYYTFWQYADSGPNPGDQDVFNGSQASLVKYAQVSIDQIRRADVMTLSGLRLAELSIMSVYGSRRGGGRCTYNERRTCKDVASK